jgi:flagellar motor protein MotB
LSFARSRRPVTNSESENHWVSFTDVMSGLVLVFILATVALMLQVAVNNQALADQKVTLEAKIKEADGQKAAFDAQIGVIGHAEEVRANVLQEASTLLQANGIQVVVNPDSSVLSIPSQALGFKSGSYVIEPQYEATAAAVGQMLSDVIRKDDRFKFLDTVFVEGHTDSVPFNGSFGMDNWGLSTFRAIALWKTWDRMLPAESQPDTLVNAQNRPLFSMSGYADTRSIEGAPAGLANFDGNRRIDIRITVIRPSSADLKEISRDIGLSDKK